MNQADLIREIRGRFQQASRLLNELQRRQWAATEALKLGRGGITIVSQALRMSRNTIRKGLQEIAASPAGRDSVTNLRIRKPGGGRKSNQNSGNRLPPTNSDPESVEAESELRAGAVPDEK